MIILPGQLDQSLVATLMKTVKKQQQISSALRNSGNHVLAQVSRYHVGGMRNESETLQLGY